MPASVAIAMPSFKAAPALPSHSSVGAAFTSDADFGKLFCEKAGAVPVPPRPIAAGAPSNIGRKIAITNPAKVDGNTVALPERSSSFQPGTASQNLPPALRPAQSQGGNTSRITGNINRALRSDSSAKLSATYNISRPEEPVVATQPEFPKLAPSNQSTHKTKQSAEPAEKADFPKTPENTAVLLGGPPQFSNAPVLSSPAQPAASSAAVPVLATPEKPQTTITVSTQKGFARESPGESQSPALPHDSAVTPVEKSQPGLESEADSPESDPTSKAINQRPGPNPVESAASPKETGPHSAVSVNSATTQSGEGAASAIVNTASSVLPAQVHSSDPSAAALSHPIYPGASAGTPIIPAASSPNLYDRIDQGTAPALLHSGVQHVTVGIRDPELGWVEIKTQNLTGHVDATLVTASGQTHATLAAQLPAISDFLQQRDVRLGNLAVHHQSPGMNAGSGQSAGAGYGPGAQNSGNPGSGQKQAEDVAGHYNGLSRGLTNAAGQDATAFQPISYISVRA